MILQPQHNFTFMILCSIATLQPTESMAVKITQGTSRIKDEGWTGFPGSNISDSFCVENDVQV